MHRTRYITNAREIVGDELRVGSEEARGRMGEGKPCGEEGRLSLRRYCCLESLRLSSPSQQMAQELV